MATSAGTPSVAPYTCIESYGWAADAIIIFGNQLMHHYIYRQTWNMRGHTNVPALIFKQTSACVYTQHIRKYLAIITIAVKMQFLYE